LIAFSALTDQVVLVALAVQAARLDQQDRVGSADGWREQHRHSLGLTLIPSGN
jgi:hypothetical protein